MRRVSLILGFLFLLVSGEILRAGQLDWNAAFTVSESGVNDARFGVRLVNPGASSVSVVIPGSSLEVHSSAGKFGSAAYPGSNYNKTVPAGGSVYAFFDMVRNGGSGSLTTAVNLKFSYNVNGTGLQPADVVVLSAGSSVNLSAGGIYGNGFMFPDVTVAPYSQPGGVLKLKCATPRVVWVKLGTGTPFNATLTTSYQSFTLTGEGLLVVRAVNETGAELVPAQSLSGQWGEVMIDVPGEVAGTVSLTNGGEVVTVEPKVSGQSLGAPAALSSGATFTWQVSGSAYTPPLVGAPVVQFWSAGMVIGQAAITWDTATQWHATATVGVVDEPGAGRIQFNFTNLTGISSNVKIKLGGVVMAEGTSSADGSFTSSFVTIHDPQYSTEYEVLVDGVVVRSGMTPAQQVFNPEFPMPGGYDILLTYTAQSEVDNITDPDDPDYLPTPGPAPDVPAVGTPERAEYDAMRRALADTLRDGNLGGGNVKPAEDDAAAAKAGALGGNLGRTGADVVGKLNTAADAFNDVQVPEIPKSDSLVIWSRPQHLGGDIAFDLSAPAAQEFTARVRGLLVILVNLAAGWAILAVVRKAFI